MMQCNTMTLRGEGATAVRVGLGLEEVVRQELRGMRWPRLPAWVVDEEDIDLNEPLTVWEAQLLAL